MAVLSTSVVVILSEEQMAAAKFLSEFLNNYLLEQTALANVQVKEHFMQIRRQ